MKTKGNKPIELVKQKQKKTVLYFEWSKLLNSAECVTCIRNDLSAVC